MNKKIVLITGASRGIGNAIAKKIAQTYQDCFIIGTATTDLGANKITNMFHDMKLSGVGMKLELRDKFSISDVYKTISEQYGFINILINNAAITKDTLFLRMKTEQWEEVINVDLTAVYELTKCVIREMLRQEWGRIINISSVVASIGNIGQTNYVAAKAGLIGFTKALALEVATRNVTVNAVAPGFIETDMTDKLSTEQKERILALIPMKKIGDAEDVANVVSFLASEQAGYITGQTLHVNGGMYMI